MCILHCLHNIDLEKLQMSIWLYAVKSAGQNGIFFTDFEQLPREKFNYFTRRLMNSFTESDVKIWEL